MKSRIFRFVFVAICTFFTGMNMASGAMYFSPMGVSDYRESQFDVNGPLAFPDVVSSEVSKGTGVRKAFMTPRKIFNRIAGVQTHYIWSGRLLDNERHPLDGAILLNVMSWIPLGSGSFTLETAGKVKTLYVMKNDTYWQCGMKVSVVRDVIRYVRETACQRTELASLPAAEQKQVGLMTAGLSDNPKTTAMNKE